MASDVEEDMEEEADEPVPLGATNKMIQLKKCQFCRKYVTKQNLARHLKILHPHRIVQNSHHKNKFKSKKEYLNDAMKFVCPEPCNKVCSRQDNLVQHQKSRNCYFNKPFICLYCQKRFAKEQKLKKGHF